MQGSLSRCAAVGARARRLGLRPLAALALVSVVVLAPACRFLRGGAKHGPRPLPATFVPLELDAFPRAASAACAARPASIVVAAGESIAAALEVAQADTTILVEPGVYVESQGLSEALVVATEGICLRSAGPDPVVLQAAPGQPYGLSLLASRSVIEGFTLRGFAAALTLVGGGGATLEDVTLERVVVEDMTGEFRDGITVQGDNGDVSGTPPVLDGFLVLDSRIDGADLGLSCNGGPCDHVWVEGVEVTARTGAGTSGADAFAIESGRQVVVVDSTFRGAEADGVDIKASDAVLLGVRVEDVGRNGIKLWRGGDVLDSLVDGSGADAALVGAFGGRYRYAHVLVTHHGWPGGNGYVGTWAYDDPLEAVDLELVNSIFYANASGGLFVPAGAALSVRHTLFDPAAGRLFDVGGAVYDAAELAAFEAAGWGEANQLAEPAFNDPTSGDFSTAPASPARDVGEPVAGLDRDIDGAPRAQGGASDAGPVETPP